MRRRNGQGTFFSFVLAAYYNSVDNRMKIVHYWLTIIIEQIKMTERKWIIIIREEERDYSNKASRRV